MSNDDLEDLYQFLKIKRLGKTAIDIEAEYVTRPKQLELDLEDKELGLEAEEAAVSDGVLLDTDSLKSTDQESVDENPGSFTTLTHT